MAQEKRKKKGGGGDDTVSTPVPTDKKGRMSVLIEFRHVPGASMSYAMSAGRDVDAPGFEIDEEFEPVSMTATGEGLAAASETFVVRGTVKDESEIEALRSRSDVTDVWMDTPIAPFPKWSDPEPDPQESPAMAPCPIPPCDCDPRTPKGTIADVANYLGANRIWSAGFRGTGMVVGVLDGGITAQGRPVKSGETSRRIPRVIGGWPSDWGTEASKWSEHGNMCATDVLGMAPDAQIFDLRISGAGGSPGTISRALQAFNWALNQYRTNGTPQVLTNSWGIFQEDWDTTYARNPNHPFTRKVVEAINAGILVLFAAGNCGDTCPDGRCGSDVGPGKSIWGANGHPQVMTVGAVNINEQFIGYSSRGPAALDPNKPDFCSISHFRGYNISDSGTSAATPILAGVVALLKQAKPGASQSQIKAAFKATAKDIGPSGFDQHSGAGIIQAFKAYQRLVRPTIRTIAPPCRPTRMPPCRPTIIPPCRTLPPSCIRPTVIPSCRTLPPRCPRPTISPPCRTLPPACPRPTINPPCRTLTPQCPRPTLASCPRPTQTCPRPTLRCPRPTLTCPRPTLACPRPPGFEMGRYPEDYWYEDPYTGGFESPYYEDPYYGTEYDYGTEEFWYPEDWEQQELSNQGYYDPYAQWDPYQEDWGYDEGETWYNDDSNQ